MKSAAQTPQEYIASLPDERKAAVSRLRQTIKKNLPKGFKEVMGYGMIGYVVPHNLYPDGYHCDPALPLPFINLASQKNFIAVYHMGIYADPTLMKWYVDTFAKTEKDKRDMGKSCLRFKKPDQIPFDLIGELVSRMSVEDWIATYEKAFKSKSKTKKK